MGCPETLITDQGREFVNGLSAELYAITKTEHRITSAYHPQVPSYLCTSSAQCYTHLPTLQSNGLTERFNQTLSRSLAKITCSETHDDWDLKLDTVLMGYRASRQASTKFSPYYMLFQKEMRLPIQNEVCPESGGEVEPGVEVAEAGDEAESGVEVAEAGDEVPEFGVKPGVAVVEPATEQDDLIEKLLTARELAFKQAEENILNAQKKQKESYDRKHQPKVLPVGARVLLENTKQKQRKGGKLEPIWLGPYTISRDLGNGLYELSNEAGKVLKTKANIARLKEYQERSQNVSFSVENLSLSYYLPYCACVQDLPQADQLDSISPSSQLSESKHQDVSSTKNLM